MSQSDALVRALRRRLWVERLVWLLLLCLLAALHFGAARGGQRAILIIANREPVTVVASRSQAQRLLDDLKTAPGVPADAVKFLETVSLRSVSAAHNPIQSDPEAMRALAAKLHPVVRGVAIVTNGEVVLALPDQKEAVKTLSAILSRFSPPGEDVTRYFKEQVKVEARDVPPDKLYPSADKAIARIEQASAPKAEYEVRPGDSAWKIAQKFKVPLSRLAAANQDVDMNKVRAGTQIKIPGELPPLTVIARKQIEERVGEGPEAPIRRIRTVYENGAEVSREVVGRPPRRAPSRSGPPLRSRRRGDII